MVVTHTIECNSYSQRFSPGINKAMWDYHYKMGKKHGLIGIKPSQWMRTLEKEQAYEAGHYAGMNECRLIKLLNKY